MRSMSPARVLTAMAVLPSVWVLVEVLRSWKHFGGGCRLLGLTQWNVGPAITKAVSHVVDLASFL